MNQNCQLQRAEIKLKPIPQVDQSDSQEAAAPTLRELFDSEESSLLRYAFSLTGRRAVAEEIVQEVFLRLHTQWDEVQSPRAWLYRSVRNRAFNHHRDNKREILSFDGRDRQSVGSDDDTPDSRLLRRELSAELRLIIEELADDDRQLVKLKYFQNLKYCDISAQTGLSIGNVGYRLHHILKGLAEKLRRLGIDDLS